MDKTSDSSQRSVDFESGIPLHLQVREIIREEALKGNLIDENGKMPTESELTERFNVSRVTVRNALQNLVKEGMLIRERGRGTFLKTNQAENWVGRLMGFTETIREAGYKPDARILEKGMTENLTEQMKNDMNLPSAWALKRLRYADDIPIAIEHAFFPPDIGWKLDQEDLTSIAMYRFFEETLGMPLKEARQAISAVNANEYEAECLNVQQNQALLYIERLSFSEDKTPAEFLRAVYRPEYFQYMVQLSRKVSFW
ncbi:GntR family transcriptional regulator [Salibacterium sp. K-3]